MSEGTGLPPAAEPRAPQGRDSSGAGPVGLQMHALAGAGLGFLMDVELQVSVELGRCKIRIDDLLRLGPGGTIKLNKVTDEHLDVRVNDRLIAHGEAVVLGEKFGVRLLELVEKPEH